MIRSYVSDKNISIQMVEEIYPSSIDTMYVSKDVYGLEGYYVNRLIVHEKVRNRKIASRMMDELVKQADLKNTNLLLEINPYGDLSYEQLEKFYKGYGFKESHLKGLYVREPKGK